MRAKARCQSQLRRRAALILLHGPRQTEYPALFMVKGNRLNTPLHPTRNILCLDCKAKLKRWHGSPCYYTVYSAVHQSPQSRCGCNVLREIPPGSSLSLSGRCLVSVPGLCSSDDGVTPGPAPRHQWTISSGPGSVKPASHPQIRIKNQFIQHQGTLMLNSKHHSIDNVKQT